MTKQEITKLADKFDKLGYGTSRIERKGSQGLLLYLFEDREGRLQTNQYFSSAEAAETWIRENHVER